MFNSIDIDTGGTFTDGVFHVDGKMLTVKVDTTPDNPVRCFMECIAAGAELLGRDTELLLRQTQVVRYSTTAATNAMIEGKGTKVGLLVSAGAEQDLYHAAEAPVWSLLQPALVRGVREEVADNGQLKTEIDSETFRTAIEELLDNGARVLVVAFRHAERNPLNELRAKELFKQWFPTFYLGTPFLLLSHEVTARRGDAERLNSAVISGYLHRQLVSYLYKCDEAVRTLGFKRPLLVVHSSGGLARVAKTKALNTYNSGPTAGTFGAARLAKEYRLPLVVTMDIGGTSTDVAFIKDGGVELSFQTEIKGIRVNMPMIDVLGLGGGGGSLARSELGDVKVGPDSAGAVPGPACYDLGNTQPTVTDADVVLGLISANNFLGGKRRICPERAEHAVQHFVALPLSLHVEQGALRIRSALARQLAASIRDEAARRKVRLEDAVVFAYGGAGPVHAADICEAADIGSFYVFPDSPVFSAAGCSSMDIEHLFEARVIANGRPFAEALQKHLEELKKRAQRDIRGEGFVFERANIAAELETDDGAVQRIDPNKPLAPAGVQSAVLRISATIPSERPAREATNASVPDGATRSERDVVWSTGCVSTPVYEFAAVAAGRKLPGPLLIESGETTCVVPPGWTAEKDARGAIRVSRGAK